MGIYARFLGHKNLYQELVLCIIQILGKDNEDALVLQEDEKEMLKNMMRFNFNKEVIQLLLKQKGCANSITTRSNTKTSLTKIQFCLWA